jgi:hypothetical protein
MAAWYSRSSWARAAGVPRRRNGELLDSHLFFYDRYSDLNPRAD